MSISSHSNNYVQTFAPEIITYPIIKLSSYRQIIELLTKKRGKETGDESITTPICNK